MLKNFRNLKLKAGSLRSSHSSTELRWKLKVATDSFVWLYFTVFYSKTGQTLLSFTCVKKAEQLRSLKMHKKKEMKQKCLNINLLASHYKFYLEVLNINLRVKLLQRKWEEFFERVEFKNLLVICTSIKNDKFKYKLWNLR